MIWNRFFSTLFLLLFISIGNSVQAQEYDFDIPQEEEAAKIEFSGNLDAKWGILQTNESSSVFGLQFFGRDKPEDYLSQYRLDFYFNGDYRYKQVAFSMKTFSQYTREMPLDISFFELFGSLSISPRLTAGIGKRRFNWGKGYAFNPVGYVNAEKDPENPDLALAGINSVYLKYNRSFTSGLVQNLSLSAIVLPAEADILEKYGAFNNTAAALKFYLLLQNIDIDFMMFSGKNRPQQLGMDFSANVQENIEIHGEINYARDETFSLIQNSTVQRNNTNGFSYLLGFRYLNSLNVTMIAEYYHNNHGLDKGEFTDYQNYLITSLNSGDANLINRARSVMFTDFRSKNLMQDYFYFKASLPEPFEWLYSSISIFTIYNINDGSFILSPQVGYKPFTNSEILLWPTMFFGNKISEYGGKQFQNKVEMWFRFYF